MQAQAELQFNCSFHCCVCILHVDFFESVNEENKVHFFLKNMTFFIINVVYSLKFHLNYYYSIISRKRRKEYNPNWALGYSSEGARVVFQLHLLEGAADET